MRINPTIWRHYRLEQDKVKHYGFFDESVQTLMIKSCSVNDDFDELELQTVLGEIRVFINAKELVPVRNLCCAESCEEDHYWYATDRFKVKTNFPDRQNNIDLLDRAIEANL